MFNKQIMTMELETRVKCHQQRNLVPPSFLPTIQYVSLEGVNGISFIGALKELSRQREIDWMSDSRSIKHFIGTSVGALVACLMYCRVNLFAKETTSLITDFCSFFSQTPTQFHSRYGLSSGKHCIDFFRKLLQKVFGKADISFIELHNIVGGKLTLVATDLRTADPVYISFETHPHEPVALACFSSMCLPGMFSWQVLRKETVTWNTAYDTIVGRAMVQLRGGNSVRLRQNHIAIGVRFYFPNDMDSEYEITGYDSNDHVCFTTRYQLQRVLDGCFSDNNPFSAADPGAHVLNLVVKKSRNFQPEMHGLAKYTMRVLSLSMRRVEKLMELLYADVARDTVLVDVKGTINNTKVSGFGLSSKDAQPHVLRKTGN